MAPATGHQQHRPALSKSLGSNTAVMNIAQDFVAHGRWDVGVINQRTCSLIPQRNDDEEAERKLCDPRVEVYTNEKTEMLNIHNRSEMTEATNRVRAMLVARRRSNECVMSGHRSNCTRSGRQRREDQPWTPGQLRVQADAEVVVAELSLVRIVVVDA